MDLVDHATMKPPKRTRPRGNRPKPAHKNNMVPIALTHAEGPLPQPADEGAKLSRPVNFKPELTDRYHRYGKKVANYLLGSRPNAQHVTAGPTVQGPSGYPKARAGVGPILDVSRPAGQRQQPTAGLGQNAIQQSLRQAGTQDHNTATGHRLRHRGRHGRRHIISAIRQPTPELPVPQRQYDYQALSTSQQQLGYPSAQAGSYIYPSAGVLPAQPLSPVQSASQLHQGYQNAKQGQTPYSAQYPHIIPAQRQPFLNVQGPQAHYRYNTRQLGTQGQGRWALNDQIAVSLPGAHYPLPGAQIGNLDTGSDYTWRISGFTECSKTCGGGKSPAYHMLRKVCNTVTPGTGNKVENRNNK